MIKKYNFFIFLFMSLTAASAHAQCSFSLFGNPVDKIVCRGSDAQLGVVTSDPDAVYNFFVDNGTSVKKIGGPLIGGGGNLSVDAPMINSLTAGNYYIQSAGISTNCTSSQGFYVYFGDIDDLTITKWGGGSVSFKWASCGRSSYVKYEYAVTTSSNPSSIPTADTATTYNTSATVNGLTPGVTYYIHVSVFEVYKQAFGGSNGDLVDNECFSGLKWQTRSFIACGGAATTLNAIIPSGPGVCTGETMTLTSPAATTYQWYKDGVTLGTSASVRGQALTVAASGYYSVYVTTPTCSGMAFSKYVNEIQTLSGIFSGAGNFCAGEQVKIGISRSRNDQMYEISKNGTLVTTLQGIGTPQFSFQGEDTVFYTFPITAASQGSYTVKTFNGACAKLSFGTPQVVTLKSYGTITPAAATICPAGSQLLTATGGGTYLWKKNNLTFGAPTTASITVNTAGTYSVTITNGTCVADAVNTSVITAANPTGTITPASASICPGGSQILTATGGTSYQWFLGGVSQGAASASPTFTASQTGTYTVTIFQGTCSGPGSNSSVITAAANPTGTITPASASICPGGSQILTATGGTSYQWFLGGVSQGAASASPTFTASQTGTYTVTIFQGTCSGPGSNSSVITASANPTGTITPATATICAGISQTLTASGGTLYEWFKNGVSQGAPSAASTFSATLQGVYSVIISNGTCSGPASNTSSITVTPLPTGSITPVAASFCTGGSQLLTASGGTAYGWFKDGISQGTPSATATFIATATGIYSVRITNNNCSAMASNTSSITETPLPTGTITPSTATICANSSQILTATGGTFYVWSRNGSPITGASNTATYTASIAGVYSVIITNNNCSAAASNTSVISIAALPAGTISPSAAIICAGSSQTLTATGGTSYQWFKDGIVQGPASASSTFSATATGVYSVTIFNNNCNGPASNTSTITVTPLPTGNITPAAATICAGSSQIFTASGGTSYEWFLNGVSQGAASPASTFNAIVAGTYSVILTKNNCSAAASNISTLIVTPLPTGTISPASKTICAGSSQLLTATGGTSYQWFKDGVSQGASSPSSTFNATVAGTYSVIITNNNCSAPASNTSVITVTPLPTGTITPGSATICTGGSKILTATGGTSYQWLLNGTSIPGAATSDTYTATQAGIYSVIIINNNCSAPASNTSTILVDPVPTGTISPVNTTICPGSSQLLTATGGVSYQWYLNSVAINGQVAATYSATAPGVYTADIFNANGCKGNSSNNAGIIHYSKPVPVFSFDVFCQNQPISFFNTSTAVNSGGVNYSWNFGDNTSSVLFAPVHTYSEAKSFTVTLTAISNTCPLLYDSVKKVVAVKPAIPGIKYPPARVIKNTPFTLTARNIGQQYAWNPSFGLNNAAIYNPVVTTTTDLQYTIKIISTGGCITVDTLMVQAFANSEVFVPKAFTPNGNNANDVLRPIGVNIPDIKYFRVYNRWGQLVFQTSTAGEGWNGIYKNVSQPMETYTWIFEGTDANGTVIKASGKTLLIR